MAYPPRQRPVNLTAAQLRAEPDAARLRSAGRAGCCIPSVTARIEQLREYLQRTQLAIPAEHYSEFLDLIDENNAALIEHREGNKEGKILTPAPAINYIPLYVLDLVVEVQKEPLGDTYGRRASDNDSDDMEAIDEAIRLSLNLPKPEPIVVPKYSVKR